MKIYITTFLLLISAICSAQYGIRTHYSFVQLDQSQNRLLTGAYAEEVFNGHLGVSLDYWFRHKKKRIEFLPEIGFKRSANSLRVSGANEDNKYTSNAFFFNFNTRIYPLDFGGDCDCPTFSKDGDLIKKGFYFALSPGLAYYNTSLSGRFMESEDLDQSNSFLAYKVGLGAGLDIGLSDFLTINPYVFYNRFWGLKYADPIIDAVNPTIDPPLEYKSTGSEFLVGVRLGLRFDELNKYGMR